MRYSFVAALCFASLTTGQALAHPGSALLTRGVGEPTAMSGNISFTEENGVHIFRGGSAPTPAQSGTELLGGEALTVEKHIEIKIDARPYRSFRRLRTQGFYSGVPHPSRRYTQGFYSGPVGGR